MHYACELLASCAGYLSHPPRFWKQKSTKPSKILNFHNLIFRAHLLYYNSKRMNQVANTPIRLILNEGRPILA